jgi:hypothetical protein
MRGTDEIFKCPARHDIFDAHRNDRQSFAYGPLDLPFDLWGGIGTARKDQDEDSGTFNRVDDRLAVVTPGIDVAGGNPATDRQACLPGPAVAVTGVTDCGCCEETDGDAITLEIRNTAFGRPVGGETTSNPLNGAILLRSLGVLTGRPDSSQSQLASFGKSIGRPAANAMRSSSSARR